MTLTVGFSRLKAVRRCKRLHWYRYVLFLRRRRPALPLLRGTILHEMLDARAKGEPVEPVLAKYAKEYKKLFAEEQEYYGDIIGDCRQLYANYAAHYKDDGLELVASEFEITLPLTKGVEFHCTIDRVYNEKAKKMRWLSDTKSHKNLPGEDARFNDLQTVFYVDAWNSKNKRRPVHGVMWDYIRTKLPAVPEVLKSGKLSQRANIDTTYAVANHAVQQHCAITHENPKDYSEWLEEIKGRENKFLRRVFLPNPPRIMIDTVRDEMIATAKDMLLRPEANERTLTKDCSWCEFRDLCHAELRGQDANFILKSEFVHDERNSNIYGDEDD